ncbi:histone-lysine N-methyltransferase SETMAR-like isoform X1 [Tupaia chinensis]|uniref:histone-lysine N-methyltransferase SETMAR-like isoform X1 n=1 Tax=Tupaia chinensis TaxID=246437 RepID=UPI000FFCBD2D|nr:histone-lysine N-methyltransferase SETMAR-like isoform X1 [Tupaia chinensis]
MNPFAGKPGPDGSETISTHFTAVRSFTQRFLRAPVPFHAEILGSGHPGTANDLTVQWWFKKFCKGDENLEDEECSGRPSEVDNDQLSTDPLTITQELAEGLNVDHCTVIQHLKQSGKVKGLK